MANLGSNDSDAEFESVNADKAQITGTTDITINVPTDFPTLEDGFLAATEIVEPRQDVGVTVNIESGHIIETALYFEHGHFGHITITSDDVAVSLGSGFPNNENIMYVNGGSAPVWDITVDAGGIGGGGLSYRQCYGRVASDSGVVNSGGHGLIVNSAIVYADSSDFNSAAGNGLWMQASSKLQAQNADFSGAGDKCAYISRTSEAAISGSNLKNATDVGLEVRRSRVHCDNIDVSGAGDHGIQAIEGSVVTGIDVVADNTGNMGVTARDGSNLTFVRLSSNGVATDAVRVMEGCHATIREATLSNTDRSAIRAEGLCKIEAKGASFENIGVGNTVVSSDSGALIGLQDVTVDTNAITASDTNFDNFNTLESKGIIFN